MTRFALVSQLTYLKQLMYIMAEFRTKALTAPLAISSADGGVLGPPPTTRGKLANPLTWDQTMSASDLKRMKELEASFLNAIDEHHKIISNICFSWCR